ncbi:hypothetical protein [Roseococcus pinisoli]|uniref:Uncharacterized protein n=1 Tax=Roseococcus pinisoli TaxID=2835040 RepID=A0ABS5QFP0_9PROT|nr:hypothetical protein [Roseococcus pinisoli]MBS7812372.1 hypothetical protein [Roseococcus pinisoli]
MLVSHPPAALLTASLTHGAMSNIGMGVVRSDVRHAMKTAWQAECAKIDKPMVAMRIEQLTQAVHALISVGGIESPREILVASCLFAIKMAEEGFVPLDSNVCLTALAITQDAQEDVLRAETRLAASRMFDMWHRFMH